MIDSAGEAKRSAQLVIKSLTDLGYSWQTQVGDLVTVRFQSVAVAILCAGVRRTAGGEGWPAKSGAKRLLG